MEKISNKKISLVILFTIIILFPTVCANGLTIVGDNPIYVNKTFGENLLINMNIQNQENFDFVNISFSQNPYIRMDTISILQASDSVNFNATITASESYTGDIILMGYYNATLGQEFKTYNITVDCDAEEEISECEKTVVIGDTILWNNVNNFDIEITAPYTLFENNAIIKNEFGSQQFNNPETFNYYFMRAGFIFTDTCTISVLPDVGYINNPLYDDILNLNINVYYPETDISVVVLETNYNISAFANSEGILSIKNIGTKIAKNVQLSGEWFSFNENNFDINPGVTKGIVYTITPVIPSTNQTNQTYQKDLIISGNFPTYTQNFSISIPYAVISAGEWTQGKTLLEWINEYCLSNPLDEMCIGKTKVIIQNLSDQDFNVSFSQQQVKSLFEFMFEESDARESFENFMKEILSDYDERLNTTALSVQNIQGNISGVNEEQKSLNNNLAIFFIFLITVIFGVGFYIYIDYIKRTKKYNLAFGKFLRK